MTPRSFHASINLPDGGRVSITPDPADATRAIVATWGIAGAPEAASTDWLAAAQVVWALTEYQGRMAELAKTLGVGQPVVLGGNVVELASRR